MRPCTRDKYSAVVVASVAVIASTAALRLGPQGLAAAAQKGLRFAGGFVLGRGVAAAAASSAKSQALRVILGGGDCPLPRSTRRRVRI